MFRFTFIFLQGAPMKARKLSFVVPVAPAAPESCTSLGTQARNPRAMSKIKPTALWVLANVALVPVNERLEARGKDKEAKSELKEVRKKVKEAMGKLQEVRDEVREARGKLKEVRGKEKETKSEPKEVRSQVKEARSELREV